jgi:hypothetical protein
MRVNLVIAVSDNQSVLCDRNLARKKVAHVLLKISEQGDGERNRGDHYGSRNLSHMSECAM